MRMIVGQKYPMEPPQIAFLHKINMPGVNQTNGAVDASYFNTLKNWDKKFTIMDALKGIRKEMESSAFKKLTQPEEGSRFSK